MPASALARLEEALSELAKAPVELERPAKAEHGDYATNVALRTAPVQRRPPKELAQELAEQAGGLDVVVRAEVAGPGFVNLWLAPSWFAETLGEMLEAGADYGGGGAPVSCRILVSRMVLPAWAQVLVTSISSNLRSGPP